MTMLDKYLAFVNEQIAFHEERVKQFSEMPKRANKHQQTADTFVGLRQFIQDLAEDAEAVKTRSLQKPQQLRLSLTPDEIDDLPEELLNELSISAADRAEYLILNLLEDAGGVMSLDQILVGIYRATKEIPKRTTVTNRLYRMSQKNLIHSVPNKKGVYSLYPITEEQMDKLLSGRVPQESLELNEE